MPFLDDTFVATKWSDDDNAYSLHLDTKLRPPIAGEVVVFTHKESKHNNTVQPMLDDLPEDTLCAGVMTCGLHKHMRRITDVVCVYPKGDDQVVRLCTTHHTEGDDDDIAVMTEKREVTLIPEKGRLDDNFPVMTFYDSVNGFHAVFVVRLPSGSHSVRVVGETVNITYANIGVIKNMFPILVSGDTGEHSITMVVEKEGMSSIAAVTDHLSSYSTWNVPGRTVHTAMPICTKKDEWRSTPADRHYCTLVKERDKWFMFILNGVHAVVGKVSDIPDEVHTFLRAIDIEDRRVVLLGMDTHREVVWEAEMVPAK